MFDISFTEILVVAVVALLILKPEDVPGLLHKIGQFFGKLKEMTREFQSAFEEEKHGVTTIIDMDGNEQVAYDVSELDEINRKKSDG